MLIYHFCTFSDDFWGFKPVLRFSLQIVGNMFKILIKLTNNLRLQAARGKGKWDPVRNHRPAVERDVRLR